MKVANYTHMTSPIRRLVDLVNQLIFISLLHEPLSNPAQQFLDQCIAKLPYINTSMRSIRKIQTDCEVLYRCYANPSLFQSEHKGILFDKEKKDGKYVYMVYLEEVRILTRFKSYEEYENLSQHSFQLFFFTNEHSLKKKIRIQIIK